MRDLRVAFIRVRCTRIQWLLTFPDVPLSRCPPPLRWCTHSDRDDRPASVVCPNRPGKPPITIRSQHKTLSPSSVSVEQESTHLHFGKRMLADVLMGAEPQTARNVDATVMLSGRIIVQIVRTVVRIIVGCKQTKCSAN